jgi:group I intron endonuclease
MRKVYIYTLKCPIDNTIRYVGQSLNPEKRLKRHIRETKNKKGRKTKKESWIQKLINLKLEENITLTILEECDECDVDDREIYYIQKYRELNCSLVNMADGGKSLRLRGENHPNYGKTFSDDLKKKLSEGKIGEKNPMYGKPNPHNLEWSNKISLSLLKSDKLKQSRKSKDYRNKISDIQSNKTLLLDNNTFEIKYEFKNCREVADFFNYTYANIKAARRNKRIIGKSLSEKYYVIYEKDFKTINNIKEYFNELKNTI